MTRPAAYDDIVAGAGAAGCVLAARLAEDPAVSVPRLEAGGPPLPSAIGDARQRVPEGRGEVGKKSVRSTPNSPAPLKGGRIIAGLAAGP